MVRLALLLGPHAAVVGSPQRPAAVLRASRTRRHAPGPAAGRRRASPPLARSGLPVARHARRRGSTSPAPRAAVAPLVRAAPASTCSRSAPPRRPSRSGATEVAQPLLTAAALLCGRALLAGGSPDRRLRAQRRRAVRAGARRRADRRRGGGAGRRPRRADGARPRPCARPAWRRCSAATVDEAELAAGRPRGRHRQRPRARSSSAVRSRRSTPGRRPPAPASAALDVAGAFHTSAMAPGRRRLPRAGRRDRRRATPSATSSPTPTARSLRDGARAAGPAGRPADPPGPLRPVPGGAAPARPRRSSSPRPASSPRMVKRARPDLPVTAAQDPRRPAGARVRARGAPRPGRAPAGPPRGQPRDRRAHRLHRRVDPRAQRHRHPRRRRRRRVGRRHGRQRRRQGARRRRRRRRATSASSCSPPARCPGRCPAAAPEVASRLGAGGAGAFDIGAGCAGFTYALALAADAVRGGSAEHVLVIGSEKLMPTWSTRTTAAPRSCSATAPARPSSASPSSDGDRPGRLGQRRRPGRRAASSTAPRCGCGWRAARSTAGPPRSLPDLARRACAAAGIELADLAAFVPHQANLRITESVVKSLKPAAVGRRRPRRRRQRQHQRGLGAARARAGCVEEGQVRRGDPVLLLGFGAGLTAAGQVVRCPVDLSTPTRPDHQENP